MRSARVVLALAPALLGACATDANGWGTRGRHWTLYASPTLQVRRGPQVVDPVTHEIAITWIGARSLEGEPPLLRCELEVFDDRDGDRKPGAGELRGSRESLERTDKVLFGNVRVPPTEGARWRARIVARTESETCEVSWVVDAD